jgi:hypothetical protein
MEWTGRLLVLGIVLLAAAGLVGKILGPSAETRFLRAIDVGSLWLVVLSVGLLAAVILIAVITSF